MKESKLFPVDTYAEVAAMMNGSIAKQGETEDGTLVLCEFVAETSEVAAHYELRVPQKNGWTRVKGFYPDGTITETFEDFEKPQ